MYNIIREYLVNIKTAVDHKSAQDAIKNIDENMKKVDSVVKKTQKVMEGFAGSTTIKMGVAATAFVAFSAAVTASMGKVVSDVARADMEIQKLSRRMFTSLPNAYSLRTSMEAMGLRDMEDLKDVALNPELRERFARLRGQSFAMMPGGDYQEQMKKARDIQFEFTRMKLEMTYGFQQIGYYFMKSMAGPINELLGFLRKTNDFIQKNLPNISKKVAGFFELFARNTAVTFKLMGGFFSILDKIPNVIKNIGVAAAGLFLVIKSGPIGWLIAGLQTLYLLLDDIFTYAAGGKSLFGKACEKVFDIKTNKSPIVEGTKNFFGNTSGWVQENLSNTYDFIKKFQGQAGGMANITSVFRPQSKGSKHSTGEAFDFGLAGTSFNQQTKLFKELLGMQGLGQVLYESNNMADKANYQKVKNYLESINIDTSKMKWYHNSNATGPHGHTTVIQGNTYNIKSNDPAGVRREIENHDKNKTASLYRTNAGVFA